MNTGVEVAWRDRVRGSVLGGAIGDALGAPVEFDQGRAIVAEHPERLRSFVSGRAGWPPGTITDDTQMTLFTMEGLIRASVRTERGLGFTVPVVHHAYDRWLDTQLLPAPSGDSDSTGAICGNILGALHGEAALPSELAFAVEGRAVMLQLADDFALEFSRADTAWAGRYPGW